MTKITPDLLIEAYKIGVFPMANNQDDPKIDFFDPDPRGIIPLENFHISRSLRKLIRKGIFKVTYNTAFPSILEGCSQVSRNRPTTWINHEIKTVYKQLFDMGYCHSIEIWCERKHCWRALWCINRRSIFWRKHVLLETKCKQSCSSASRRFSKTRGICIIG